MGILLLIVAAILIWATKYWIAGWIIVALLAIFARGEFWYTFLGMEIEADDLLDAIGDIVEAISDIDFND